MTKPNFENIQPLIASQEVKGSSVEVQFHCADSGIDVPATGSISKAEGVKAEAGRSVKKNMWSSLRRAVTRAITDAVGSGAAGRVARDVATKSMSDGQKKSNFSKAETQDAVVTAFESVQSKFRWDAGDSKWVGLTAPATPFAQRLLDAPVKEKFDQGVLARALVELSAADGSVGEEERAFIGDFLDPELGSIDDFLARPALSAVELNETTETTRETILMLSWACAMCDEDVADAEIARINELATGLGVTPEQTTELRNHAQQFLFEQALTNVYEGGNRNVDAFADAVAVAGKMGVDTETAERFDAGYRRRNGLV